MSPLKYYNAIKYYFSAPDEKRSHWGHRGKTPTQVPALDVIMVSAPWAEN